MRLFGSDANSGTIQKISDWFGMNFIPKLSPGLSMSMCKYRYRVSILMFLNNWFSLARLLQLFSLLQFAYFHRTFAIRPALSLYYNFLIDKHFCVNLLNLTWARFLPTVKVTEFQNEVKSTQSEQ